MCIRDRVSASSVSIGAVSYLGQFMAAFEAFLVLAIVLTMGLIAIVATINGVLIQIIMVSRVLYGLADRQHMSAFLAAVSPRTRTPVAATLGVIVAIVTLSLALPIEALAERISQLVLVVFFLVNIPLIRLKGRAPDPADVFAVPLWVPYLGTMTSAGLFIMSVL